MPSAAGWTVISELSPAVESRRALSERQGPAYAKGGDSHHTGSRQQDIARSEGVPYLCVHRCVSGEILS